MSTLKRKLITTFKFTVWNRYKKLTLPLLHVNRTFSLLPQRLAQVFMMAFFKRKPYSNLRNLVKNFTLVQTKYS